VDKETLLKPRAQTASGFPEDEVPIPGVGTVTVRGLSRFEARLVQGVENEAAAERKLLALGLVDPKITEDDAARWQKVSDATELEAVTDKITELSGLKEGAAKEAVKEFEADPDAEFRVLPGSEARDDGGPATHRDEQ